MTATDNLYDPDVQAKIDKALESFKSMELTPEEKADRAFTRDKNFFRPSMHYFPFGKRKVVIARGTEFEMKRQQSRGIAMEEGESIADTVERMRSEIENPSFLSDDPTPVDMHQRIQVKMLRDAVDAMKDSSPYGFTVEGITEVGFRHPDLLYYLGHFFDLPIDKLYGIDIAPASVDIARIFGISSDVYNLGAPIFPIHRMNQTNLVVCWHVLEHVHDPAAALRRIYRDMPPGGLLSVEVPIEDGMFYDVNSDYGHSILLEKGDLEVMCRSLGFMILKVNRYVPGGNDSGVVMENLTCVKMM